MIPRLKDQYYKTVLVNLSKKFEIKNKLITMLKREKKRRCLAIIFLDINKMGLGWN